ncbi:hypothetical protein RIF29_27772 [Crotalaria pallida]|uniref:Homeobox domain-containing protein n=1 Tax=Crotalaria pallida TaxID=3830 RepID=A0AAN9I1C0_CROPI
MGMGGGGGSNTNNGTCSSTPTGSRWNPTKEQISMLENLYDQGIKTPSEEQIKQITFKLRAYGHIEGKNVFYWFQNHKARQRQKQKQESIAYFNRYPNNVLPSTHWQNVVFPPYCLPQNEINFYSQHPNVLVPGCISPRNEKLVPMVMMPRICDGQHIYEQSQFQHRIPCHNFSNNNNEETLTLFPLHPTGILDAKTNDKLSSFASVSDHGSIDASCSSFTGEGGRYGSQPFFDFLTSGQQSSRESDGK